MVSRTTEEYMRECGTMVFGMAPAKKSTTSGVFKYALQLVRVKNWNGSLDSLNYLFGLLYYFVFGVCVMEAGDSTATVTLLPVPVCRACCSEHSAVITG